MQLPEQVYRLDFKTRAVKVVADGFGHVNGIALSPDGKKAYMYVHIYIFSQSRLSLTYPIDLIPRKLEITPILGTTPIQRQCLSKSLNPLHVALLRIIRDNT